LTGYWLLAALTRDHFLILKGGPKKLKFCFPYISSPGDWIFKIYVSIPHNTPLIMGDRQKNFEDPITCAQDIRKTKFDLLGLFLGNPLGR
jgi:hypothetical protein